MALLPSLDLPIFDGGRLKTLNSAQKRQEKDQAIALYNTTLLDALKEASDAASTLNSTRREMELAQNVFKVSH
jgi:outer membrane protein TolC